MVSFQALLGNPLLFLIILFIVRAKEINIIIVVISSGGRCSTTDIALRSFGELLHASAEGLDVIVPPKGMGVLRCRSFAQSLVHLGISLRRDISFNVAVVLQVGVEGLDASSSLQISEHGEYK